MPTTTLTKRPWGCFAWLGVILLFLVFCSSVRFLFWVESKPHVKNQFLAKLVEIVGKQLESFQVKSESTQSDAERAKDRMKKLETHRAQDTLALENYGLADPQKKIAKIPIEKAMELTVERLKNKPVRPADPILLTPTTPAESANAAPAKPAASK